MSAQGDYTIQFQDNCEPRLISKVMEESVEQVHARVMAVTVSIRSISDEGECMIEFEDKAGNMGDIKDEDVEADDVSSGKVAEEVMVHRFCEVHRKNRGDYTIQFQDNWKVYAYDTVTERILVQFSCECAIQFQDYSEARVISMMTEFQATVLR
ncbi:Nadp-Dependent Malic Enzyme [Manis pentadactyla]|nr:Nadp-Dependent Malic Enzyme [Manis pentadactyla]